MSINSRKLAQELDKTSACFFIICTNSFCTKKLYILSDKYIKKIKDKYQNITLILVFYFYKNKN